MRGYQRWERPWGDLTQWRSFRGCQGGGEEVEPWPPPPPNCHLNKDRFYLLYILGFREII